MKNRRNPYLNSPIFAAAMTVAFTTSVLQAGTTWDGGGGTTTNINTASNWDSDVVNALNGTTAAIFGTGGSTATINTNASFTGITINRNAAFTIANGNGSLTIGSGGITVTLPNTTGRTHTISESSVILGADQTWSVTNNTGAAQLDVTGVISGSSRSITKTGTGTLRLTGVNTFNGGLSVDEGTVLAQTTGSALGAGVVNLGSTVAGTNNVVLALGSSSTFNNAITVRSGNSGTVTINNFGAYNPTLAGTITLNKGLILNNNDSSSPFTTLTVSGKITGGSGLTVTGSNIGGETILSNAANDYTGTTAVNSGTLRLTGSLANTAVTVASGAAIAGEGSIGSAGSLTFGNGSFLKVDPTTTSALTVEGNLSFGAATNVILDAAPTVGLGTTFQLLNYSIAPTGSLTLQNASDYRNASISTATPNQINMTIDTKALTWSGASGVWEIGGSSSNWNSAADQFYQGDSVTFTDAGTNKALTLGVSVIPASVLFDNSTGNDYSVTGAGAIAGRGVLTKSGDGTLTLSTVNTYSGGTTLSGGKIIATVANALGSGAVTNNATLDLTAGAVTYTGLSSSMTGNGTVNVSNLGTGSNSTNLNGDYSGFTGTVNIGVGAAAGAGRVLMNGADNASATVNVLQHGTLLVSGAVTKSGKIYLNGGDTGEALGQLRLEQGAIWDGDVVLAGDMAGGDFTVGSNGGGGTISGDISEIGGPRALSKGGPSTIVLSGSNSYTGLTTSYAGILKLGSAGALGSATVKTSGLTVTGGTLDLFGQNPDAVVHLALNSSSNGPDVGSLYNTSSSTSTWAGTVSLGSATVMVGSGNINLTDTITGNSSNLNKNGLGTLALTNSGTVTLGTLQANRGTIQVGSGSTLNVTGITVGSGSSVGSGLTLDGGDVTSSGPALFGTATSGTASGTLTLKSGTLTVPSLAKGGSAGASVQFNANFNGGTLKANANSATFFTGANSALVQAGGAIIHDGGNAITIGQALIHDTALDSPSVTPDGGLTKQGLGTLTLNGTNTYTGETEITAGTLALGSSGSVANSSQIIVGANTAFDVSAVSFTLGGSNAQILSGTGAITGNMTVGSQGTLAIGSSPGKMTFGGNLGLNADSISNFEINDFTLGNYDLALAATAGTQTVSFNGGTLNLLFQTGFSTSGSVKIFDFDLYSGSGFTTVDATGLADGFTASFDKTNGIVTVIPEPRVALLGGLGLLALLRRRRAS